MSDDVPVWLERARAWIGVEAIAGAQSNPSILGLYAACGHPEIRNDDTAWCAAWIGGGPLAESGIKGTGSLLAASYFDFGVPLDAPRPGAIAVWPHHVAIVSEVLPDGRIKAIGGNQGHSEGRSAVTEAVFKKSTDVRYRWPVPLVSAKDLDKAGSRTTQKGLADICTGWVTTSMGVAAAVTGGPPEPDGGLSLADADKAVTLAEQALKVAGSVWTMFSSNPLAFCVLLLGGYLIASGALLRLWRASDANTGKNTARSPGSP